jgi:hypothetical protein
MARIRSIGLWSAFKLFGVLYGLAGLVLGGIISLLSMLGFLGGVAAGMKDLPAFLPVLIGAASIVIFPLVYGMVGAIGGVLASLIYNLAASLSGGLEVRLE